MEWMAGGPSPHDGARLREGLIDPSDTASDVRADSVCRSAENERFLAGVGKLGRIHRRQPKGKRDARAHRARHNPRVPCNRRAVAPHKHRPRTEHSDHR